MVILKKILTHIVSVVLVLAVVLNLFVVITQKTYALSKACQNSKACMDAVAAEEIANGLAAEANDKKDAYSREVAYKNYEIAEKQAQIAQTKAEIEQLIKEIDEAEKKLLGQQDLLAGLLVDMYFSKTTNPVMILAGSNTISELAEKEAREKTVNNQIASANKKIEDLKSELEQKRELAEANLAVQEIAENQLKIAKKELEELVNKYANDTLAYEAQAEKAREEQLAAERAEQEAHPELYRIGSYYGSFDTYEWQAYCPEQQDYFTTYIDGYPVGGYVCECVSYAGWKAYEYAGVYLSWGNANTWDDYGYLSYVVDNIPSANSIGQADSGYYGHVWWVESVNPDGSVNVTEYNNAWATYLYTGDYHFGDFGARTIPAYEAAQYNYIHLDQPL